MKKAVIIMVATLTFTAFATQAFASGKTIDLGTRAAMNYIPWWGSSYNACRFQCLWLKSEINYAGYINEIWWDRGTYTTSGSYSNVRAWLCHTTKTQVEATFNNNYTTFTPVQVKNATSWTLGGPGWYNFDIDPNKFNYNNSNNLLLEVRWRGDSGVGHPCGRTSQSYRRVYNMTDDSATTGSVQNTGQVIRLVMDSMTGLEPTSLGRVKSIFR